MFTDVQELAAMGGLDTHASENSLWVTASRAGIVDVDRWVVAAVLWQATDAVEQTVRSGRTDQIQPPPWERSKGATAPEEEKNEEPNRTALETVAPGKNSCADAVVMQAGASCASAEGKHIGEGGVRIQKDVTGATTAKELALVSAEATSLWEELCQEVFRSVLDSNRNAHQTRLREGSSALSAARSPSSQREGQQEAPPSQAGTGAIEPAVSEGNDRLRQVYGASTSNSSSFDHALVRTLQMAGHCTSEAVTSIGVKSTVAVTPETTAANIVKASARSTCVEEILIYTYAIAGLADGSGLELADIVEAVKFRRQRAATGGRTTKPSLRGAGGGRTGPESVSPLRERTQTVLESRESKAVFSRQGGAAYKLGARTTDGNGEGSSAADALGGTETQLVEIPAELRQLFRAAALADSARKQQQQHQHQVEQGVIIYLFSLAWSCVFVLCIKRHLGCEMEDFAEKTIFQAACNSSIARAMGLYTTSRRTKALCFVWSYGYYWVPNPLACLLVPANVFLLRLTCSNFRH